MSEEDKKLEKYLQEHPTDLDPHNPLNRRVLLLRMRIIEKEGKLPETPAEIQEWLRWVQLLNHC
jgi:hypothetical protein